MGWGGGISEYGSSEERSLDHTEFMTMLIISCTFFSLGGHRLNDDEDCGRWILHCIGKLYHWNLRILFSSDCVMVLFLKGMGEKFFSLLKVATMLFWVILIISYKNHIYSNSRDGNQNRLADMKSSAISVSRFYYFK